MNRIVVDLNDRRPIWSLPDHVVDEIRGAAGPDWEVHRIEAPADGSGDGVARTPDEVLEAVRSARVYMGYGIPEAILEAGPHLEWIHSGAAGVGGSLTPLLRARPVLFTNSAGIHGPPMAETVLAMILHFARGLDRAIRGQREGRWAPEAFWSTDPPVREVAESTVGIVGFGGIGQEVARRALALGAQVVATRRRPLPSPIPGVHVESGDGALERVLEASDYVVLTAPETDATRGLIGADELRRMKPDAVLVNVSRGTLLQENALLDALEERRIRGAALDVFAVEPLPSDHPLWRRSDVLLTPHVSATTGGFWRREADLIVENVRRFLRGETLLNLVDKEAGY